jgi:hypothetical protein
MRLSRRIILLAILDQHISRGYSLDLCIAPVGEAWFEVPTEKDFPRHYLHMTDRNHPTMKGSYLTACVIYSTIFGESTEGSDYHAWLQAADAEYFQKTASSVVLDHPERWHKQGSYNHGR